MIGRLLSFTSLELATFWKRPLNLIMFLLFGFMSFGFVTGGVRIGLGSSDVGGAKPAINSQANLLFSDTVLFALILPFFVAVTCGMPLLVDSDRRIHRLIHATPISMLQYAISRLLGSLITVTLVLLAWMLVQMAIYQAWPLDPNEAIRVAFNPLAYLWPLLTVGLPQMLCVAGVSMWLGVRTRQPVLVFAMPVVILLTGVFFIWTFRPEWLPVWADKTLMMVDVTGLRWLSRSFINEDRGVAFYNTRWILPDAIFIISRVGFIVIGLLCIWATGRRLERTERQDQRVKNASELLAEARSHSATAAFAEQASLAARGGPLESTIRTPGFIEATWHVMRQETRSLLRSPGVWLFGPLILLQIYGVTAFRPGTLDTESIVTTGTAAAGGFNTITLLLCFLTLFYTVESLVREERCGLSGIFRSTATPTAAMLAGKSLANAVLAMIIVAAASLGIGLVLITQGVKSGIWKPLEPSILVVLLGALLAPTLIVWTSFVVFLFALLRNRFVVYGVALGVLIGTGFATQFGYVNWITAWHLWGVVRWSELDRIEFMWSAIIANRAIVLAAAVAFICASLAIWPRRTPDLRAVADRVQPRMMWRTFRTTLLACIPLLALAFSVGLKIRQGFEGGPAREARKAYWQRNSKTWEGVPVPALDRVEAEVKLHPESSSFEVDATYVIRNPHSAPMAEVPLTLGQHMESSDWKVDGVAADPKTKNAAPPSVEDRSGLYVITPSKPLAQGETTTVKFRIAARFPGGWSRFSTSASEFVLPSGVVLTSFSPSFLPVVGFVDGVGVEEGNSREPKEFSREHWRQRVDPLFGAAWRTDVTLTIEGPESWTLNSVGTIREASVSQGRKRVVWKTESPVRFFNIVGGPLTEVDGPDVKVFHDARTPDNVKTMVEALASARRRYSEWFGPYPWNDLKLTQFPGLAGYAQGFPGNISFSEAIGFLTLPSSGEDSLDSAFYIVAHESGHQWWGNIVTPGIGPGGNIVSEGIANFSAAMLMHRERGDAQRRVLLRRWENSYVNGRSADSERAINRTDGSRPGDQTVTYDRAGFVFWMLRKEMGEAAMLAGMKEFVATWKDGVETPTGLDFPLIEDFVEALRPHAADQGKFDAFVSQWIFGTVLPEFSLDALKVEPSGANHLVSGTIANVGTGETDVAVRITGEKSGIEDPPHQDLTVHVKAGAASVAFSAEVSFKPDKVVVDPEVLVLQAGRKRGEKSLR